MRICLLTYRGNPYCGGQGIYIRYVAEELARQGHRVTVIAGDPQPGSINGVLVHRIPNRNHFNNRDRFIDPERPFAALSPLDIYEFVMSRMGIFAEMETFSVRALPLVRKLHREEPFDIIHDNQCLGYGFLLFRQLGVPVISTIHHPLSIDRNIWFEQPSNFRTKMKRVLYYPLPMQKMVANRMDRIITVSRSAAGEITRAFKVPRERISVVYNGMDLSLFKPAGGRQQARSGLIFVGNVEDRKKGVIYLLKALTETKHPVRLTIVDGGTPARSLIPRLIDRFGLNHRVIFTGKIPLDELLRLYGTPPPCCDALPLRGIRISRGRGHGLWSSRDRRPGRRTARGRWGTPGYSLAGPAQGFSGTCPGNRLPPRSPGRDSGYGPTGHVQDQAALYMETGGHRDGGNLPGRDRCLPLMWISSVQNRTTRCWMQGAASPQVPLSLVGHLLDCEIAPE